MWLVLTLYGLSSHWVVDRFTVTCGLLFIMLVVYVVFMQKF